MDLKITTAIMWILIIILYFCEVGIHAMLWLSVFPAIASLELFLNRKEIKYGG